MLETSQFVLNWMRKDAAFMHINDYEWIDGRLNEYCIGLAVERDSAVPLMLSSSFKFIHTNVYI